MTFYIEAIPAKKRSQLGQRRPRGEVVFLPDTPEEEHIVVPAAVATALGKKLAAEEIEPQSRAEALWLIGETGVKWNRSAARLLTVAMLMLSMLVPMFCQRVIGVYRDAPLVQLNTRLQQGPAMGLYTTKEHAGQYDAICEALRSLSAERPEGRILFCKTLPWAYLCTPYGFGTPSPWRIHTENLQNYYAIHEENRADFICILSENVGGWEQSPFNRNPGVSNPNAFDYDGAFWEEVETAPVLMETPELTIFEMREIW